MAKPITVKCHLSTFVNEGVEIRKYLYTSSVDPTVSQMKDDVKLLFPQLRGERFDLMYMGKLPNVPFVQFLLGCRCMAVVSIQRWKLIFLLICTGSDDDNDRVAISTDPEMELAWRDIKVNGKQLLI